MTDPAVVANAIRELRTATKCTCLTRVWAKREHSPDCLALWREDVDTLAAELERLRRVDELARALVEALAEDEQFQGGTSQRLRSAHVALAAEVRDA